MSNPYFTDAYETIRIFQNSVVSRKPSVSQMVSEIRMMKFRVRPVSGNITSIDFRNENLIDALWSLGKLDEFAQSALGKMPTTEHETFARLVSELKGAYQRELSALQLAGDAAGGESPVFEAEIYRDSSSKIN